MILPIRLSSFSHSSLYSDRQLHFRINLTCESRVSSIVILSRPSFLCNARVMTEGPSLPEGGWIVGVVLPNGASEQVHRLAPLAPV